MDKKMRKILLVEDEDILRETYETVLSTQVYDYDSAENGQVALYKCQNTNYDLILLDLMMPVMDGVAFLEHFMPSKPLLTKIIILSNLSSGKELDRALELGVCQNLIKADLSPKQLLEVLRNELS